MAYAGLYHHQHQFVPGAVEILGGFSHFSTGGTFMLLVSCHESIKDKLYTQCSFPTHSVGQINITSGRSERASSGDLFVSTPEAGGPGKSGSIKIDTGFSRKSDSGSIDILTGAAHGASDYDTQDSGSITMQVGQSDEGNGGRVRISAGASYSSHSGKIWHIFSSFSWLL